MNIHIHRDSRPSEEDSKPQGHSQLDGIAMQSTNEHAIELLRILHMACFINPRIGPDDNYDHLNYNDYPNIVDMAKFNDLQKYTWQIHPTFHTYVAEQQKKNRFQ